MASTATKNEITLKGSVEIVTEFFGFSINSTVPKYGLSMLVTKDEGLKSYLSQVLTQISQWLMHGEIKKLVIVITGAESGEILERWVFNVDTDQESKGGGKPKEKSLKEVQGEIQAIIRQITASVTFLPLLEEPCSFDLLVYTDQDAQVPGSWEESDPKYIQNSTEVKLRSFTTKVHKVDASVAYKNIGEEEEDV